MAKLPPEFWEWAREQGLPPRGPQNSDQNSQRMLIFNRRMSQWWRDHRPPGRGVPQVTNWDKEEPSP